MIKRTIIFCITFSLILFGFKSSAQENSSNVTITATGRGASQAEAQQYALRSAIEQAYGAFISSKTEILNDEIVADQMASVANGNIQSFEILNETELPDHSWASTIKAVVSVEKLTSFVQSKGIEVEIKGGLFAVNIKQQMLNEQGEVEAIYNMVGVLHEVMQTAFDYTLTTGNPKAMDPDNQKWEIPLEVSVKTNKNFTLCSNYFRKILEGISMSESEKIDYKQLNKPCFSFGFKYNKDNTSTAVNFTLRKEKSIAVLKFFCRMFGFYVTNFEISPNDRVFSFDRQSCCKLANYNHSVSGGKRIIGRDYLSKFVIYSENDRLNPGIESIDFSKGINTEIAQFYLSDKRSLSALNSLTNYNIKSNNVTSSFSNGGITIKDNKYSVVAIIDFGLNSKDEATEKVDKLTLNGYDDWHIILDTEFQTFKKERITDYENSWITLSTNWKLQMAFDMGDEVWRTYVIAVRDYNYPENESGE